MFAIRNHLMLIREIEARETWELRRDVMWPEKDISYVQLPKDNEGRHYGLFVGDALVSVVSVFKEATRAQFRKFATLPQHQGKGYGSALLKHIIKTAAAQSINELWCNARQEKITFYSRLGLRETSHNFSKGGKAYRAMTLDLRIND